jgi:hypothetical protein
MQASLQSFAHLVNFHDQSPQHARQQLDSRRPRRRGGSVGCAAHSDAPADHSLACDGSHMNITNSYVIASVERSNVGG